MKKILDYFSIDGAVGGNQEWFKNVVMYIGGCADEAGLYRLFHEDEAISQAKGERSQ